MFNLQLAWDRPAKISSQLSEHILRVRIEPSGDRNSTQLTLIDDPLQTGELLSKIQAAALKSGQTSVANQVTKQLDILHKTGELLAHQTTSLLRTTRQLGGSQTQCCSFIQKKFNIRA